MVATVSANVAHGQNDDKKKGHLDRSKVLNVRTLLLTSPPSPYLPFQMSRQLQMRLQYAKLKVEHGWVRFHHIRTLCTHLAF